MNINQSKHDIELDDFDPAPGCVAGLAISLALWSLIGVVVVLLIAAIGGG